MEGVIRVGFLRRRVGHFALDRLYERLLPSLHGEVNVRGGPSIQTRARTRDGGLRRHRRRDREVVVHVGVDATGKHIFALGIDDVLGPDRIQSPMACQGHDFLSLHGHV